MKLILFFHICTAILLSFYGLIGMINPKPWLPFWWAVLLVYYFLIFGVHKNRLWAIRASILVPLLGFIITAPSVIYNIYAFLTQHPLYQDSPATIFVVAVIALLVTLPSFIVLVAYWFRRNVWLPRNT
jgi:hypothetical protein